MTDPGLVTIVVRELDNAVQYYDRCKRDSSPGFGDEPARAAQLKLIVAAHWLESVVAIAKVAGVPTYAHERKL